MWTPKFLKMIKETAKTPEHRMAWAIAIVADTLQIAALPFFAEGPSEFPGGRRPRWGQNEQEGKEEHRGPRWLRSHAA